MEDKELRLAVLIDADNAPRNSLAAIMAEVAIYGNATLKRIYGDWTSPNMGSWKSKLLEHAITPIQQYSYTTGKNSTDSAMIIDAMDILYSDNVDGFVLVSSDSDFTRLAVRLREAGQKVYGIGERKTPPSFIAACDKFIYIEVIRANIDKKREEEQKARQTAEKVQEEQGEKRVTEREQSEERSGDKHKEKVPQQVVDLIADSLEAIADDDGYAFMGELGNLMMKKQPDFDPRNFGFSKLTNMVRSLGRFEIDVRQTSAPNVKHIYLRDKERESHS